MFCNKNYNKTNDKKQDKEFKPFGHIMQEVSRADISLSAKGVYLYIAGFCGNKGECYFSLSTALKELHISQNTFYKYVKELEDAGILEREQRKNKATIYRLIDHKLPKDDNSKNDTSKFEDRKRDIKNNNTKDVYNSIVTVKDEKEEYLTQNKYFTYKQKQAILKITKGDVDKARKIERHIFGAKKTAIKDEYIDFKQVPISAWIRKICRYIKKANDKRKYLFNSLINEFKEFFGKDVQDTNNSYRPKAKKVIVPEWEEAPKKEIEEASEEEKENLLAQLAALRAKTKLA